MNTLKGVTVLGSTGSIGVSTLDVIARHPGRFKVVALTANTQVDRLCEQCQRLHPDHAVMLDESAGIKLREMVSVVGLETEVTSGMAALQEVVANSATDIVMAAIVGAAGLLPTLAAVQAGVPVSAYPPATVKKTVVGAGAADKTRVAWMVARLLPGSPAEIGHDASDALAVALCHAAHLRQNLVEEAVGVSRGGAGNRPGKGQHP